jgi:hypothetical protein
MRSKTAAESLAVCNNWAIGWIGPAGWTNAAKAGRHYDAQVEKAWRLILGAPS